MKPIPIASQLDNKAAAISNTKYFFFNHEINVIYSKDKLSKCLSHI